jgi:hypothetical protein
MTGGQSHVFSPTDIKFFLLLAMVLGLILIAEIVTAKTNGQIVVAVILNATTMLLCPAGVYAYRRLKRR